MSELGVDGGLENKLYTDALLQLFDVRKIKISPYNSKGQGGIERSYLTLQEAFKRATDGNKKL
ncbi:hypothetical protein Vi05172_g13479 [Venturia inaequalis]|nr:hypothetical protein Vi05172_g13479 [Venturia inaequalis]